MTKKHIFTGKKCSTQNNNAEQQLEAEAPLSSTLVENQNTAQPTFQPDNSGNNDNGERGNNTLTATAIIISIEFIPKIYISINYIRDNDMHTVHKYCVKYGQTLCGTLQNAV